MRQAWVLVIACAIALAGCASTSMTGSWSDAEYAEAERPQRTLVVAMFPSEASRRTLETSLVSELSANGVTAVPATRYFEETKDLDREAITQVAQREGFDTVVMSRFLGVDTRVENVPGNYGYAPYYGLADPWMHDRWYVERQREARIETSLFEADEEGKLVWTATSTTVDPKNSRKQLGEIAYKVVGQMKKDAIL